MKVYQAVICLIIIIVAGIIVSSICRPSEVAAKKAEMPEVEIEWVDENE